MPATSYADHFEQIVQWLEEPSNQSRFKKGSGLTKKAALAPLGRQFPTKTAKQIFDKYSNIKRAHSKAAQLNYQSGWGLMEEDLVKGTMTQRSMFLDLKNTGNYNNSTWLVKR
jgi:hypothetical protein